MGEGKKEKKRGKEKKENFQKPIQARVVSFNYLDERKINFYRFHCRFHSPILYVFFSFFCSLSEYFNSKSFLFYVPIFLTLCGMSD